MKNGSTVVYCPIDYNNHHHFFYNMDMIHSQWHFSKIISLPGCSFPYSFAHSRIIDYREYNTIRQMFEDKINLIIMFDLSTTKYKTQTQRLISEGLFASIPIINVREYSHKPYEKPMAMKMPKQYEGRIRAMDWDKLCNVQEYDRIPVRI